MPDHPRIALCHSTERASNLRCASRLVLDDIRWSSRHSVLVKPNLVSPSRPYANTHYDALAVLLEEIRARYDGPLSIAEGCALEPTADAFESHGYGTLATLYEARLIDLNAEPVVTIQVYDRRARPLRLRLARSVVESNCRVSLSLPKTHDAVLVTLSIKNMIMGSLVNRRLTGGNGRPAWLDRVGPRRRQLRRPRKPCFPGRALTSSNAPGSRAQRVSSAKLHSNTVQCYPESLPVCLRGG